MPSSSTPPETTIQQTEQVPATIPTTTSLNSLYLAGKWNFTSEYAQTSDTNAKIEYKYDSKDLYFVTSSDLGATAKILLDGQPITAGKGADVTADSTMHIGQNRLYKVIAGSDYSTHTIEIDLISGTLNAYTFTFG